MIWSLQNFHFMDTSWLKIIRMVNFTFNTLNFQKRWLWCQTLCFHTTVPGRTIITSTSFKCIYSIHSFGFLRFIQEHDADDWQIYPSRDGDTLWNSRAIGTENYAPHYVHKILMHLQKTILANDEEKARNKKVDKKRKADAHDAY